MKPVLGLILIFALAAGGCASGGGGGDRSAAPKPGSPGDPAMQPLRAGYEPSPCGTYYGYPVPCVSRFPRFDGDPVYAPAPSLADFTTWEEVRRSRARTQAEGLSVMTFYELEEGSPITATGTGSAAWAGTGYRILQYDEQGRPLHIDLGGSVQTRVSPSHSNQVALSEIGQGWLDFGRNPEIGASKVQTRFLSVAAAEFEITANPYALGWSYQSFGFWDWPDPSYAMFGAGTYGSATPAAAVPASGTASFKGKLGGLYVSAAGEGAVAAAELKVDADFARRELRFASSNTVLTRDTASATARPQLDMAGTLTYAHGSNTFAGNLTSAGGTLSGPTKGSFYGPKAIELGGVFTLRSPSSVETFIGAYGAKR